MYGGVEAGGTKFVCAVGTGPGDIRRRVVIETTDPDTTLGRVEEFFRPFRNRMRAVGVASFGPVELRPGHPDWGKITSTPKEGWRDVDVAGRLASVLDLPIGFDTDVNGAALGEWRWGAGVGLDSVVYITVGTGIGGGAVIAGRPLHGLIHPEMGHVSVERRPSDDFPGICPYHGDCLEGMVSGPAIARRFGKPADRLGGAAAAAADLVAEYLAAGLRQVVYVLAPQRIIVGGGVSKLPGVVEKAGVRLLSQLAGYGVTPEHRAGFVVRPGLREDAGILGAFVLAERAAG